MNSVKSMSEWSVFRGAVVLIALTLGGEPSGIAQENVAVRAPLAAGALPTDDPNAAAWNSATPATFPISPQATHSGRCPASPHGP